MRLVALTKCIFVGMCCVLYGTSVGYAQRDLKDIPNPDPELERKSFIVADGFEVNLFAADPLIAKPIQMNFDARGRLWIASSSIYPQIQPGQKANDRILIIEDQDHDGVADSTQVFVDGLLIPTAVEPGDGGAYVANSTELVHFKDTDGDGKADDRRVMLSGFGTEDTHHILHTFRWGMDGQLYFNQSVYIHSHLETPHGVRRLNGGGVWQFRPETMELSVLMRGLVNPWGFQHDAWGQSFATDGAGGEGINYVFPGASFVTAVGVPRIMKGLNPGSPKHCGMEIVGGRHLPDDWQGNVITNDFRGHRVCRFVLSDDGSGFASREQPELIKTNHVAFRPIDVKMGPDGAIYIADWYNPIIQHGEVDFRDPRRDLTRGRIWRITAKGRPLVPQPKLVNASTKELLDGLRSPEQFTRHHAKRQLKERGTAVVPELAAWVKALNSQDPQFEHLRLEGLWTYQSLNVVEPDLLQAVLNSPDPRARAAAVRIVPQWASRMLNAVTLLASRVIDEHPRVRLEAVRALATFPTVQAIELAMQALDRPVDQNIDYALWLTARDLESVWLPKLQAGQLDFGGNARHLIFVLQAAGSPAVVKPLLASLQQGQIAADRANAILKLASTLGDAGDLQVIFDLALSKKSASYLNLLETAARLRNLKPSGDVEKIELLLNSSDEPIRVSSARLVGLWKVERLRQQLIGLVLNPDERVSREVRLAATEGLIGLGGNASRQFFTSLTTDNLPSDLRIHGTASLAAIDAAAAAKLAPEILATAGPISDPTALYNAFLEQKGGPGLLVAALEGRTLPANVAKIGIRAIRNSIRDEPALIEALTKAGQIKSGVQTLTVAEMQQLVSDVANKGDAAQGEALFRRQDMNCFRCHAIGGAGGQTGPDLVSLGASAQVDYIIDSLLNPSKQIKEGYHSLNVLNNQGKVFTGIKVTQTDRDLILRTADGEELPIPLDTIEEQANGGSLMPVGLTDPLTRDELVNLVRFLSELGKVGPYSVPKVRYIRRWEVLTPAGNRPMDFADRTLPDILRQPDRSWVPIYTTVAGTLPLADLPTLTAQSNDSISVLKSSLDVTTAGQIQLQLNDTTGVQLWLDDKPVPVSNAISIDLTTGAHQLVVAIERKVRKQPLQVELQDVAGSAARVKIGSGK